MPYTQKAESCSRSSLLCVSGEKAISSPAARNVFRFWTNAPESPFESKYTTRKGKSLRRTIWNWLQSKIERTFTAAREAVACFSRSPRDCFGGIRISAEINITNVHGDYNRIQNFLF